MREILFRGKRESDGKWVYGNYIKSPTCQNLYMIEDTEPTIMDSGDRHFLGCPPVDPSTVGQYTGLKDKNGKRIFEGDICRNTKTGEIVSVKWHGTMAGFVWNKRKENSHLSDFGELFRVYDKYEVIGNIHDNPELMDGGAENE